MLQMYIILMSNVKHIQNYVQ